MANRPQFSPTVVMNAASMAANITSLPTIIQKLSMISYSFVWSGTAPVGTVSIQVSNDYALNAEGGVANAGTWNTITLNIAGTPTQTVAISGNTGNGFIDIDASGAYAMRAIYTATSGTGALTATIAAKVA